jgi:hypothetical protein
MAAQGKGARIGDILSTELRPYDVTRISIGGPEILLSPKLALTMALLSHELATNEPSTEPYHIRPVKFQSVGRTLFETMTDTAEAPRQFKSKHAFSTNAMCYSEPPARPV